MGVLLFTNNLVNSAGYSQDTGKITNFYSNLNGDVGIQLDNGFHNANKENQCPNNNGFAGVAANANPFIKSALLSAKAANKTIVVTTYGCQGSWLKIVDMYIK